MTARPRRKRKGDRITNPGATRAQIECDYALAGFDETARQMEREWGIDRLPALVSAETAAKYGRAIGLLNEAIDAENSHEVARIAAACQRGLLALDKEARELGAKPMARKIMQCEFEGKIFSVVQDIADLQNYQKAENEAVFTMREFAVVMKAMKMDGGLIEMVKQQFPAAQITQFNSRLSDDFWKSGGDAIPL